MTVRQLLDSGKFSVIHEGDETEREITVPFCCDLLSVAMGRAPQEPQSSPGNFLHSRSA